ncbi:MAG: hypothetical protein AB8F78_19810 [Saprospiraceae bacterium]
MIRIVLVLSCLLTLSSCATLMEILEAAAAQQAESPSQSTPQNQQPATKTFEQMDANSDGRLSSTEAQGSVKDGFAKLDSNKDGFLTKAEVEGTARTRTDKRPNKR